LREKGLPDAPGADISSAAKNTAVPEKLAGRKGRAINFNKRKPKGVSSRGKVRRRRSVKGCAESVGGEEEDPNRKLR